jgi:hypothetical protein
MNFLKGKVCDQFHKPSMGKFRYWNTYSSFPLSVMVEKKKKKLKHDLPPKSIKSWISSQCDHDLPTINLVIPHTNEQTPQLLHHSTYISIPWYPTNLSNIPIATPFVFLLQWLFSWIHDWQQGTRICSKIKFATY